MVTERTHINFISGGIGSWAALQRIVDAHGTENVVNIFTDTLIEDRDLYRFLIESTAQTYGIPKPVELLKMCEKIPDITSEDDVEVRKRLLPEIAAEALRIIPGLTWIADGRTPWDVFHDKRYLGNSRKAQCSHKLKQDVSARYVKANYAPDNCVLYLGIDWSEEHRTAAPIRNWTPYTVKFPMCEEPYVDKTDAFEKLAAIGIKPPRLYELGFAHNNCGGFCVRGGHGHFTNLLEKFPEQYAYHEQKEETFRQFVGKDVTIMKKERRVGEDKKRRSFPFSKRQLRQDLAVGAEIDRDDIGGCGCFVTDTEDSIA